MNEVDILKKQIDALEKLLQIKDAIISEQEKRISKLEQDSHSYPGITFPSMPPLQPMPPISIPSVFGTICPKGGLHDYPTVWHGTTPPTCSKCNTQAPSYTITSSNTIKIDDGTTEL